ILIVARVNRYVLKVIFQSCTCNRMQHRTCWINNNVCNSCPTMGIVKELLESSPYVSLWLLDNERSAFPHLCPRERSLLRMLGKQQTLSSSDDIAPDSILLPCKCLQGNNIHLSCQEIFQPAHEKATGT